MSQHRIPPIQCLLTFEALARLRSASKAAEELCVTPSAVSHRVRQLEQIIGKPLFGRADFSLTTEGSEYLAHVREGITSLQRFPTLQVSIPLLDVVAEDADLMIRFGTGRYADVEHLCLMTDEVTPLAAPDYVRHHGPLATIEELQSAKLIKSPLEPWRTWFLAHGLDVGEPAEGSSFNDIGLMCDAAAQGLGVALVRLKLGAPWLDSGALVRVSPRNVPSPHAHYLCWRTGALDRWEVAAFADWLQTTAR